MHFLISDGLGIEHAYEIFLKEVEIDLSNKDNLANESILIHYDKLARKPFQPAFGNEQSIELLTAHVEKHIGKVESVFHELVSEVVHIDVHIIKPSEQFPFYTLFTTGMSEQAMNVPKGAEQFQYAELLMLLPSDWIVPLHGGNFDDYSKDTSFWPIQCIKSIARLPHIYSTWVGPFHTIPNSAQADPFASNTKLGCVILLPSLSLPREIHRLRLPDNKVVNFYCLYPLFKEEMEYKLKHGADALLDRLEKWQVSDVLAINRPNSCQDLHGSA